MDVCQGVVVVRSDNCVFVVNNIILSVPVYCLFSKSQQTSVPQSTLTLECYITSNIPVKDKGVSGD